MPATGMASGRRDAEDRPEPLRREEGNSYPRTEYQHLRPEDDIENVRDQLTHIAATMPDVAEAARQALDLGIDPANKRVFDSSKVGDHTAIIPIRPDGPTPTLSDTEQKIFDLIVGRFVGASCRDLRPKWSRSRSPLRGRRSRLSGSRSSCRVAGG